LFINLFKFRIETLLKAKAQIDQKLHETTTDEEKNAFERLNYILKNPIMSFIEGSAKKLSRNEAKSDENKPQERYTKRIDTTLLSCNQSPSIERKPDMKFKLEKDFSNLRNNDVKYESENVNKSSKRHAEKEKNFDLPKENFSEANDYLINDEFLKLPQDDKFFSKKKFYGNF